MKRNVFNTQTEENFGVGARISFIVVSHRSEKYLKGCLASLFKNAGNFKKETTIVNNSDDQLDLPEDVRIINASENRGFGSACNLGAKESTGDILCFLNPDTEILKNVRGVIDCFDTDNKIGIVGARLVDEKNIIQEWCAGKKVDLSDIIGNNLGFRRSRKIWESDALTECAWISGACLFIRKGLFDKLNGFDKNFFLYFEDIDLCKRAGDLGYKIIYYPEFTVKHFGGKSFSSKKEQKKLYYEAQDYYFRKHFGKIRHNLLKLIRRLILIK